MRHSDKAAAAWSNLGRRKVRTLLTSIGVIVGVVTIVTMVALVKGVQLQVHRQFEKLGLDRVVARPPTKGGFGDIGFNLFGFDQRTRLITPADLARWRAWPEVRSAVPDIEMPTGIGSVLRMRGILRPVRILGAVGSLRGGPFPETPTALAGDIDLPDRPGQLVLSRGLLNRQSIGPARYASLLGQHADLLLQAPRGEKRDYALTVVGISSDYGPSVRVSVADRLSIKSWWYNAPDLLATDGYDSVTLRTADVSQSRLLVRRLRGEKFEVQSIDVVLEAADRIFSVVEAMLAMVGGLTLLVAGIGIVNTMIMSIYERTREIGTLKALGASNGDIREMFTIEAALIGLLGGGVGLVMSWLLSRALNHIAAWYAVRRDVPLPSNLFLITPMLAMQALLFAIVLGVLAGLYPANRAARLDPLAALRHE